MGRSRAEAEMVASRDGAEQVHKGEKKEIKRLRSRGRVKPQRWRCRDVEGDCIHSERCRARVRDGRVSRLRKSEAAAEGDMNP